MNFFFKFKNILCALMCATLLMTAPAQAGLWSSFCTLFSSTQNRVIAAASVVGLVAISYFVWKNSGTKPAEKQKEKEQKKSKELGKEEQSFNQAVAFIQQDNAQGFQQVVKMNPKIWCCSDVNGKALLMHIAENFRGTGFMPDFSQEQTKNIVLFNVKDKKGKTALMYSIAAVQPGEQKEKVDFIKKLIEKKEADVFAVDNNGDTVLHYAAQTGCVNLVKFIAEKMVAKDPTRNPFMRSNNLGRKPINDALVYYMANSTNKDKKNYIEVYVYLQNSYCSEDGRILQHQTLTLDQLVEEFFENGF